MSINKIAILVKKTVEKKMGQKKNGKKDCKEVYKQHLKQGLLVQIQLTAGVVQKPAVLAIQTAD